VGAADAGEEVSEALWDEPAAPAGRYTIDELSARTGMPSRRIRFYQTEGVLPPPAREGRTAIYSDEHLRRLRFVQELHDHGLRLSAISEIVAEAEAVDPSLQRVFDLRSSMRAPWGDDAPAYYTTQELFDRIGEQSAEHLDELIRLKYCEPQPDGTLFVRSPAIMEVALRFEKVGVDLETLARAGRILEEGMEDLAERVLELFVERTGRGFTERGTPVEVATALEVMRPAAKTVAAVYFAHGIEEAMRRYVEAVRDARQRGDSPRAGDVATAAGALDKAGARDAAGGVDAGGETAP
jgi:DNA-binding transcriptional MerR regulator